MKQSGNYISGEIFKLEGLTKGWNEVVFAPTTFYRNEDEICETLTKFNDLYTTMDLGHSVIIRMNSDEDTAALLTEYHEYL